MGLIDDGEAPGLALFGEGDAALGLIDEGGVAGLALFGEGDAALGLIGERIVGRVGGRQAWGWRRAARWGADWMLRYGMGAVRLTTRRVGAGGLRIGDDCAKAMKTIEK
ncbi:MAG: hypothetical protein HY821_20200 [Acidobacteria bacterium]|nr:hypothetical protein [Acidobacteriota bacterium]